MRPEVHHAIADDAVVAARRDPGLARSLNSYAYRGQLERLLPGVYGKPGLTDTVEGQLAAARAYGDDLVLTRRSAAALTWWPELVQAAGMELACPRPISPGYGFSCEQRLIPWELLTRVDGMLCTTPELTVLDLMPDFGLHAVTEALRRGAVTPGKLERALALTPHRRGNQLRRKLVADVVAAPWSFLETEVHAMLRDAGIHGWVANRKVVVDGVTYFIDVAFDAEMVAIEMDGFETHGRWEAFHHDREKWVALATAGWQTLAYTAQTKDTLLDTLPKVLTQRRRLFNVSA